VEESDEGRKIQERRERKIIKKGPKQYKSRGTVVGIATGYGLDDRGVGVRVQVGSRIFSSPQRPDRF
jgi:hypothetical protein